MAGNERRDSRFGDEIERSRQEYHRQVSQQGTPVSAFGQVPSQPSAFDQQGQYFHEQTMGLPSTSQRPTLARLEPRGTGASSYNISHQSPVVSSAQSYRALGEHSPSRGGHIAPMTGGYVNSSDAIQRPDDQAQSYDRLPPMATSQYHTADLTQQHVQAWSPSTFHHQTYPHQSHYHTGPSATTAASTSMAMDTGSYPRTMPYTQNTSYAAHPDHESMVGKAGYPEPTKEKAHKSRFTADEDKLLRQLKEEYNDPKLSWKQIADFFPGRKSGTLQVRYCTKIKQKNEPSWTDDAVSDMPYVEPRLY